MQDAKEKHQLLRTAHKPRLRDFRDAPGASARLVAPLGAAVALGGPRPARDQQRAPVLRLAVELGPPEEVLAVLRLGVYRAVRTGAQGIRVRVRRGFGFGFGRDGRSGAQSGARSRSRREGTGRGAPRGSYA